MINKNFFSKKQEFLTLKEILEITNSEIRGSKKLDLNSKIYEVSTLNSAKEGDISFFHSIKYISSLDNSKASYCFIEEKYLDKLPKSIIGLVHKNPYFAYATLLKNMYEDKKYDYQYDNNRIEKTAIIGANTQIMPGAYIGHNVKIGDNCYIGPNCSIANDCQIGNNSRINALTSISHCLIGENAIIHSGVKIGQDGFGFAHNQGVNHKILQLGIVRIGNDVEIGANSCIDRGAIEDTIINDDVKIDNLVQIAHNVQIDTGSVLAGCAAVAGSVKIGKYVQVGGGANISGHLIISDGAKIAGGSGVVKNVDSMQSVGGLPALPIKDWHRITIKLLQLIKPKKNL